MRLRTLSVLAAAGLPDALPAQTPSFSYSFSGAPASAAPGQTFEITVLCGFTPGHGSSVSTAPGLLPVMGLESGRFSILGTGGEWSGLYLLSPLNFVLGTHPGTVAASNVSGVVYGTGNVPPAVPSSVNPTPVWRGTFTMPGAPVTLTLVPNGTHYLWAGTGGVTVPTGGPASGTQIVIIPAPGAWALLAAAGIVGPRRRRAGGAGCRRVSVPSGRREAGCKPDGAPVDAISL